MTDDQTPHAVADAICNRCSNSWPIAVFDPMTDMNLLPCPACGAEDNRVVSPVQPEPEL